MNPEIDEVWAKNGRDTIHAEHFNVSPDADLAASEALSRHADIILTPSMMTRARLPTLPSLARFRIPDGRVDSLEQILIDGGLDPALWFCVLHYREPNYEGRGANTDRDLRPDHPIAITRYIIEELGGQVVRIGHAEMSPFPKMTGFLDLRRVTTDIQLQAAAVARSRFFLELSPSGPMSLALCFAVPVARCNALTLAGPAAVGSVVLNQHIVGPDGATVPIDVCVEKNLLNEIVMRLMLRSRGYHYVRNTLSELKSASLDIFKATADCPGWREAKPEAPGIATDHVAWPIASTWRHRVSGYDAPESLSAREGNF
jgi:putative glycosyltransferase (TIGR04372 family)